MKMSDKELDKLFSSQLADMEMEPSAAVWNKIKLEVSGEDEKKKNYMPYLQIAAAVAVFLTAALLLRPHAEKIILHGDYTASLPNMEARPSVITPQADSSTGMQIEDAVTQPERPVVVAPRKNNVSRRTATLQTIPGIDTIAPLIASVNTNISDNDNSISQPSNAQQPVLTLARSAGVVTPLNIKPVKLLAVTPPVVKDNTIAKKKKIRNLGDLLNVMIAKVDKRPKKIIEFNDDDDDDTFNPTHINLGLIETRKNK